MTRPSMGRRSHSAEECDLHARRVHCYLSNHSGAAKVKRAARRRDRRKSRQEARLWRISPS